MDTAERREAPGYGVATPTVARPGIRPDVRETAPAASGYSAAGDAVRMPGGEERAASTGRDTVGGYDSGYDDAGYAVEERESSRQYRPLWVEEPAKRRRLPDPVRTAAVRAVLVIAVTLIQAVIAFLCTMAGSWLAFPMVISSVVSTVVATWGALDVWVTRQMWNQRNGVVSTPSAAARSLRRERRRARRQAKTAARTQERISRRGGSGQLSHS
ncbi:hypothetical protein OK074_1087 [Actinobacteria bacterium OK074]|nr:hypothetical protein OK074_1087 [Actinobacteria bacterium OK074]